MSLSSNHSQTNNIPQQIQSVISQNFQLEIIDLPPPSFQLEIINPSPQDFQSDTTGSPINNLKETQINQYYERLIKDDSSGLLLDIVDEELMKQLRQKLYYW